MPQKSSSQMASIRYKLPRGLWLRVTVFSLTTGWKKRDTLIYLLEHALDALEIPKDIPTLLMAMGYDLQGMLDASDEELAEANAAVKEKRAKKAKAKAKKGGKSKAKKS